MTIQEITKGYKFNCIIRTKLKDKLINQNIFESIQKLNNNYDVKTENIKIFDLNRKKIFRCRKMYKNKKYRFIC